MADNYLQFSEQIEKLSGEEQAWLEDRLDTLETEAQDDEDIGWLGFRVAFEGTGQGEERSLWVYAEEFGEFAYLEKLLCEFLSKFRPTEAFTLTYAVTCSKMRISEFAGGAMVVTAKGADYMDAGDWASKRARAGVTQDGREVGRIGLCMTKPPSPCAVCSEMRPLMYAVFYKDGTRGDRAVCNEHLWRRKETRK